MSDNIPASLTCPTCGAPLDADGTRAVVKCKFCGNNAFIPGMQPAQSAVSASTLDEIRRMAGTGNLTAAIERYRQVYGVNAQEAQNALEALQAGRMATASAPGASAPEELTKALEEVQRKLLAGNKIDAIKIYREHYDVSLARAKYAVEQIEAGQTASPEAGFPTSTGTMQGQPASISSQNAWENLGVPSKEAPPTRPVRKWLGCSVTVAVLLVVGAFVLYMTIKPGGLFSKHYYPNGPVVLVPSGQAVGPDVAALLYDPDSDSRFIGLVDGTTGKLRWQAAKLSGNGSAEAVASGSDLVYAANATDLLAYKKSDGSVAWHAQMPDKLNYGASVMLVAAGRVITDNADQTIQAYDAESGSLVWSKRLSGYERTLRLMDGLLVIIDYTDSNNNYGLLFLDPATGEQKNSITPTCTYNDYTFNIDPDAGLVYDQANNAIFLEYGSSYGCVQRIDLATGQPAWSSSSQDSFNFAPDGFQYLMTDSSLYFSDGSNLMVVDKSSGDMKVLLTNPDYDLLPLASSGQRLILRARRTRGTERFLLLGVDSASGILAWQVDMLGAAPIDPPNELSGLIDDTSTGWTWKLLPTGLVVLKFQAKPNQLVMETFNPANGTSQGQQTIALNRVSGDFYSIPKVIGWEGSVAYLSVESNIYALDASTAKLKLVY